jgi:GGDEF domain-containing protein
MTNGHLPDLLPPDRFMRLLPRLALMSAIVGDHYAMLLVQLDTLEVRASFRDDIAGRCANLLVERLQDGMPTDALMTRLREDLVVVLAFSAMDETAAVTLATKLQERIRRPIETPYGQVAFTASIGIAFTSPDVHPIEAMQAAERAVARVRLNGGDATWVGRPEVVPPQRQHSRPVMTPSRELLYVGIE